MFLTKLSTRRLFNRQNKVFNCLIVTFFLFFLSLGVGAEEPAEVEIEQVNFELCKLESFVYCDDDTGLLTFDAFAAKTAMIPQKDVQMVQEILAMQNEMRRVGAGPKADEPVLYSTIGRAMAMRYKRSSAVGEKVLQWLETQMEKPSGHHNYRLYKPVNSAELFRAAYGKGLSMDEIAGFVEEAKADWPDWTSPESVYERIRIDFPSLSDKQISRHFQGIVELYQRDLRYKLLDKVNAYSPPDGIAYTSGISGSICPGEIGLTIIYPTGGGCALGVKQNVYDYAEERFGPDQVDTKEDSFRHPLWNVLLSQCIANGDPDVHTKELAASIAELFTTAHESCHIDDPVHEKACKMDLHNNKEGLNYYLSVAENKQSCVLWIFCTYWVEIPDMDTILHDLHQNALDASCVSNIGDYSVEQLRSYYGGHHIYFKAVNNYSCSLSSYMYFDQNNVVFGYARGNTSTPAVSSVYLYKTPSVVYLSGTGHNQDSDGYVRVMRVDVNGTIYTPISWLTFQETENFSSIPAYAFHQGYNTVKAYIHWSNSSYDEGHWVTLKIDPRD